MLASLCRARARRLRPPPVVATVAVVRDAVAPAPLIRQRELRAAALHATSGTDAALAGSVERHDAVRAKSRCGDDDGTAASDCRRLRAAAGGAGGGAAAADDALLLFVAVTGLV